MVCRDLSIRGLRAFVQRVTEYWDSTSVTPPLTTAENQAILPDIMDYQSLEGPENFDDQRFSIDVKDLVQDMVNHGNYGFKMRMEHKSKYRSWAFYSFTHPDVEKRAKLTVVWH